MVKVWEVDDSEEYNGIEKQFLNQSIEIMSQDLVASSRAAQHQPMCDRRKNNAQTNVTLTVHNRMAKCSIFNLQVEY